MDVVKVSLEPKEFEGLALLAREEFRPIDFQIRFLIQQAIRERLARLKADTNGWTTPVSP